MRVLLSDSSSFQGKALVEYLAANDVEVINPEVKADAAKAAALAQTLASRQRKPKQVDEESALDESLEEEEESKLDITQTETEEEVNLEEKVANDQSLEALVASAEVIIVNLTENPDYVAEIINIVKDTQFETPITLIGVSTAMTWNKTVMKGGRVFKETKYKKRTPSLRFKSIKLLETLVLACRRNEVTALVVAAGVLYGQGESDLHNFFQQAWLCEKPSLPVIGDGNNFIPTIHVKDLCNILLNVATAAPDQRYIVAVEPKTITQAEIVTGISKVIGLGETHQIAEDDESLLTSDTINREILTADISFNSEFLWVHNSDLEWHSSSFIESLASIVHPEYIAARGLRPVRVWLHGPPGSGKTLYAKLLAKEHHIEHVQLGDIIQTAMNKKNEISEEIEKALEDSAAELKESKKKKKKIPKPTKGKKNTRGNVIEDDRPRIPVPLLTKLVKAKLNEPACRNKGFVLDGYPRTADEAKALFAVTLGEDEEEEEVVAAEVEEGEEPEQKKGDSATMISKIVSLNCLEDVAAQRLKELPSDEYVKGHNDDDGFKRRWARFVSIQEDMEQNPLGAGPVDVEICELPSDDLNEVTIAMKKINLYIDAGGKTFNYHPTPEEQAAKKQAEEVAAAQEETLAAKRDEELAKSAGEERKEKELADAIRRELVLREDQKLVEVASLPLRKYLMSCVVPALVDGLLDICKVQPDDPVDYLAEYLFTRATNESL